VDLVVSASSPSISLHVGFSHTSVGRPIVPHGSTARAPLVALIIRDHATSCGAGHAFHGALVEDVIGGGALAHLVHGGTTMSSSLGHTHPVTRANHTGEGCRVEEHLGISASTALLSVGGKRWANLAGIGALVNNCRARATAFTLGDLGEPFRAVDAQAGLAVQMGSWFADAALTVGVHLLASRTGLAGACGFVEQLISCTGYAGTGSGRTM